MQYPVIITFALVLGVVFGAYWLFVARGEAAEQTALRKRMKGARTKGATLDPASLVITDQPLSAIPALDKALRAASGIVEPARALINKAGVSMNVGTLLLACGVAVIATFALLLYLTGTAVVALPLAALAGALPPFVLNILANRRVAKFEEQFPEAIDLMSRALRAGHAFTTALSMVGEELPDPVGGEFKLAYDRQNFGMPLPDALRSLGARVPLIDARFFVTAVLTQREVGGNLSEVLENLAEVIRERFKVKRQVRVVTAHGRMTAWVLGSMPPVLAAILTYMNPDTMSIMWTHPTGIRMVAAAIVLQALGAFVISRLVKVDY
jgi:tight adherence protein B